jgi:hypothetical protein
MFIDDSGNVTRTKSTHEQARFGSVTGVVLEFDYLHHTFEPGFLKLKERHFGIDPRTGRPHRSHLRKMKAFEGPFSSLRDNETRFKWQRGCFSMYRRAKYHVITVGADKEAFYEKHPGWDRSMYTMLAVNAFERFVFYLRNMRGQGDVLVESINPGLDREIETAYRRFYEHGGDFMPSSVVQEVLTTKEIKVADKKSDVQGLQLADLLASTCFAHIKNLRGGPDIRDEFGREVACLMESEKFYRSNSGNPDGYGRVWRP